MEQTLGKSSKDILRNPVEGGRNLTTRERVDVDLSETIPGWGSDADPQSRVGVPKDKMPQLGIETLYPDIEPQIPKQKVHKSTEHAKLTPVFGNACPPRGLSGVIREVAYGYSEGRLPHWLFLIFADRVDMIEELALDIVKLRPPNIFKEMGLGSEFKYNKKGVAKFVVMVGTAAISYLLISRMQRSAPPKRLSNPLS